MQTIQKEVAAVQVATPNPKKQFTSKFMIVPGIDVKASREKEMIQGNVLGIVEKNKHGGNLLKMAYMPSQKKSLKASLLQKNSRDWTKHRS